MTYCGTLGQWYFGLFSDLILLQDDGGLFESGPARLRYGFSTGTSAVSVERKLLSTRVLLTSDQRHEDRALV